MFGLMLASQAIRRLNLSTQIPKDIRLFFVNFLQLSPCMFEDTDLIFKLVLESMAWN